MSEVTSRRQFGTCNRTGPAVSASRSDATDMAATAAGTVFLFKAIPISACPPQWRDHRAECARRRVAGLCAAEQSAAKSRRSNA